MIEFKRILVAAAVVSAAVGASRSCAQDIEAIALPSQDRKLSFAIPGRLAEVLIKPSDTVTAGQLLVRMDDTVERAKLEQLKAQAESQIKVKAGKATLAQKKVDLEKIEWAAKRSAATNLEVKHALLDVEIAGLSLELAKFESSQAGYDYIQMKLQLDRMRITSPINGTIESIQVHKGESADKLQEVVRVVNIDPLWINVPVPLAQGANLKLGGAAHVRFPREQAPVKGKIIHVASNADAASDTLTVRVEMPNVSKRKAGQRVKVSFAPAKQVRENSEDDPVAASEKTSKERD